MTSHGRITRMIVPAIVFVVVAAMTTVASACPSCKQALSGDGSQGDLARGIYYSVLFMMSMPFAIVGTFAGFMYRAVKREQRRRDPSSDRRDASSAPRATDE